MVQQHEIDVTLDPDSAYYDLELSEDGKQVLHKYIALDPHYPNNPPTKRVGVLTKQSFSSGRFYLEVQVQETTRWRFGVARKSINRNEEIKPTLKNGCWTIDFQLKKGVFIAADGLPLKLRTNPKKVGMFVDYDEGLVSFYDVEARNHIYSLIGCSFREPLHPLISPCVNGDRHDEDEMNNDEEGDPLQDVSYNDEDEDEDALSLLCRAIERKTLHSRQYRNDDDMDEEEDDKKRPLLVICQSNKLG
ncbi:hypothetical protein NHX12_019815 [Muraenolepis orangiensis]|uniref:B30.2/SPRY domain-containing protein n=1 Tax=Muraenolepis orangiensis TaxID=630683 RepID=A0A9Q0EW47_9TELE|nr:hypothetical protein NHX12_019815 [Muraenolepis orangiensis]